MTSSPDVEYLRFHMNMSLCDRWHNSLRVKELIDNFKSNNQDAADPNFRYQAKRDSVDWIFLKIIESMKDENEELNWKKISPDAKVPNHLVDNIFRSIQQDKDDRLSYECAQDAAYSFVEYGWIPVFPEPKSEFKM